MKLVINISKNNVPSTLVAAMIAPTKIAVNMIAIIE